MNTHHIDLAEYRAKSRGNGVLYLGTAGSHGNEQLQVTLGEGWEGLTVQAIFHPSQVAVQLPANGVLDVPWEATEKPLTAIQGKIVFQGFNQDRLVNTIDLAYTVAQHSSAMGRDEEPYTPGIVEGVLNQMAADKEEIMSAAQQADQAKTIVQQSLEKVEHAAAEALDHIAAAAPALPAVSAANAGQVVTVKPDGSGYQLAGPFIPVEAGICRTVSGNPAICENGIAWIFQDLRVYGGVQTKEGMGEAISAISAGESGKIDLMVTGRNLLNPRGATLGAWLNTATGELENSGPCWTSDFIPVYKGVPVYRNNTGLGRMWFYDRDKNPVQYSSFLNDAFSPKENGYIRVCGYNDSNPVNSSWISYENLEEFEPYKEQSIALSTPSGLTGIQVSNGGNYIDANGQQWMCDMADFGLGKKVQRLYQLKTSDLQAISFQDGTAFAVVAINVPVPDTNCSKAVCNIASDYLPEWNNDTSHYFLQKNEQKVVICGKGWASIEDAQAAIDAGIQLIYPMLNPVVTELSDKELSAYHALTAYSGTTVVFTTEPVAGIDVGYIVNGNQYIEKYAPEKTV